MEDNLNKTEEKWRYIQILSAMSDYTHSDLLIDMMEKYKKPNLQEMTYEECSDFYKEAIKNGYEHYILKY